MASDEKTAPGMRTILLIEDDEISRLFLAEAISQLPVRVAICTCFADAEVYLQTGKADLIISDVNLPDGDLSRQWRIFPHDVPVLVTSAGMNEAALQSLHSLGFTAILSKPMSIQALHTAIRQRLSLPEISTVQVPLWDSQKTGKVVGRNPAALAQLKGMFETELRQMIVDLQTLFDKREHQAMHDNLHKLKASCGFLGASRLLQACSALDENLSQSNLEAFLQVAEQTLAVQDDSGH